MPLNRSQVHRNPKAASLPTPPPPPGKTAPIPPSTFCTYSYSTTCTNSTMIAPLRLPIAPTTQIPPSLHPVLQPSIRMPTNRHPTISHKGGETL